VEITEGKLTVVLIIPSSWGFPTGPVRHHTCEPCLLGKMTRTPFSGTVDRAFDLLGIIHTDVCGPMSVATRNGYCYFVTFNDDLSRYGYIISLELLKTLRSFRKRSKINSIERSSNFVLTEEASI
jgi:hypothetical protein